MRLHCLKMSDPQWAEIQAEARRKGISASDLIRRTMESYLERTLSFRTEWLSSEKSDRAVKQAAKAAGK